MRLGPGRGQGGATTISTNRVRSRLPATLLIVLLAASGSGCSVAAEEGPTLPGMCNGRTDADMLMIARASGGLDGAQDATLVLEVRTDAERTPTGSISFEHDGIRLLVDDICRVWGHQPGQEAGTCSDASPAQGATQPEGAAIAHAVGITTLDGAEMVVRVDVQGTEEGRRFRVRWRPVETSHDASAVPSAQDSGGRGSGGGEDGGCGGDWQRYPADGWATLDELDVRVGTTE